MKSKKNEEPIEYSVGFVDFLGVKIDLSKKPLIPRPETAFWVRKVIEEIKNYKLKIKNLRILDIFAGSGCIGIAILKACPEFCRRVDFGEIDKKFLKQIEINLKLNKISRTKYRLLQSDIFQNINPVRKGVANVLGLHPSRLSRCAGLSNGVKGDYNYILANPPYVAKSRQEEVQKSVLDFEPEKALFGGKEGLLYIKKFLKEAKGHLKKEGKIYLEFDPQQKEKIKKILERYGYTNYRFFKDQYRKFRYLTIKA